MKLKILSFALGILTVVILITLGATFASLPSEKDIKGCLTTKMFKVYLCPDSGNYVPLKKINPIIAETIMLTEDSNFYQHKGFDWLSIETNFKEGWKTGAFKRGGSTITQQLAKNMFLSSERTFTRKGLEALITNKLENTLTKKEILEKYLNVIEFGEGVYGIKNAARYYFKKSPAEVNTAEAAFLAMILPNPKKYSASFYKKELTPFAYKRMNRIINDLYRYSRINEEAYSKAQRDLTYFFGEAPPFGFDILEGIDLDTFEGEITSSPGDTSAAPQNLDIDTANNSDSTVSEDLVEEDLDPSMEQEAQNKAREALKKIEDEVLDEQ